VRTTNTIITGNTTINVTTKDFLAG